jgi:RHS repeat-associated protein
MNRITKATLDIGVTGSTTKSIQTAGYDVAGKLVRVVDANNNATTMTYNSAGLLASLVEPSTPAHTALVDRTWSVTYDTGGLATVETRPGGVTINRTFDGLGRLTAESGSGTNAASASRSFAYDSGSRMTGAGSQSFSYDARGLMTGSAGPQGASTFVFDAAGRMLSRNDAAVQAVYGWNARSNMTSITAAGTFTQFGWYPSGELDAVSYPGGTNRKYMYDDAGRVISDEVKSSAAAVVSKRSYSYNPDNSLASSTITQAGNSAAGTYSYSYDRGSRLRSTTNPGNAVTYYTYDNAGNRLTAGAQTFAYDARNRLTSGAGTSYNWSARGTLLSTTGTGAATYAYDGLDRMTQSGVVSYAYDSLDRVTTRTQAGSTTTFSYAGNQPDPVGEGSNKYVRTPGGQSTHIVSRNSVPVIVGADRRGDATFTLNTTGGVQDSTIRDPFGTTLGSTGASVGVGYQSDWTDPTTGLVWMAARWYQPSTGTFLTRDTYPGEVGVYATLNRYTYAINNPLTYSDPTGRKAMSDLPGCDIICQLDNYDDVSFNDRFQRGDRDAETRIVGDAIIVVWDQGVTISTSTGVTRSNIETVEFETVEVDPWSDPALQTSTSSTPPTTVKAGQGTSTTTTTRVPQTKIFAASGKTLKMKADTIANAQKVYDATNGGVDLRDIAKNMNVANCIKRLNSTDTCKDVNGIAAAGKDVEYIDENGKKQFVAKGGFVVKKSADMFTIFHEMVHVYRADSIAGGKPEDPKKQFTVEVVDTDGSVSQPKPLSYFVQAAVYGRSYREVAADCGARELMRVGGISGIEEGGYRGPVNDGINKYMTDSGKTLFSADSGVYTDFKWTGGDVCDWVPTLL